MKTVAEKGASRETAKPDPVRCLWCDGVESVPSWQGVSDRLCYVSGKWNFRRCLLCGTLQLDPLPTAERLSSYYPPRYDPELVPHSLGRAGQAASQYNTRWPLIGTSARQIEQRFYFNIACRRQTSRVIRALTEIGCDLDARRKMLDIGCGRGLRTHEFHRRGFEVEGVDFQLEAVHHVRQHLKLRAWHLDADQISDNFPPESFDLITAFYLLEHVHNPEFLIRSCWKLLRHGGVLVIAVPLADSWQARMFGRRWSQITEAPRHLSLPTQVGIQRLLRRAGFGMPTILPDGILALSAMAGLSLIPNAAATYGANHPGTKAALNRAAGAMAAAAWIPWTAMETFLARRPAAGLAIVLKTP